MTKMLVPASAPVAHPPNARQAPHRVATTHPDMDLTPGLVFSRTPREVLRVRPWDQPTRQGGQRIEGNPSPQQPVYWSDYAFDCTLNTAFATDDYWIRWRNPDSDRYDPDYDAWAQPGYQGEARRVCCPQPTCGFEFTAYLDHEDYWSALIVVEAQHDHHAVWIDAFNRGDFSGHARRSRNASNTGDAVVL